MYYGKITIDSIHQKSFMHSFAETTQLLMKRYVTLIGMLLATHLAFGQVSQLKGKIEKIIENKALELGFALYDFSTGDTLSINGNKRYPMQSVFKFPIALAVLDEVDKQRFELHQKIQIGKEDLRPGLWSPIAEKYPGGDVRLPLSEIIKQTVSLSDNVGCDLLLKLLGGAPVVNRYIHSKGVTDICIQNNELEIQSTWSLQFENWVTPNAMVQLLKLFNNKELLQNDLHTFLWNIMAETTTGSLRNKLPRSAVAVHKTGHSGYNKEGVSAATNDVGVLLLPNGKRVAFAIFITNSREPQSVNADIIADIAVALYSLQ